LPDERAQLADPERALAVAYAPASARPALAALFALMTLLLIFMHRENIKRLLAGTEGKIGQKA